MGNAARLQPMTELKPLASKTDARPKRSSLRARRCLNNIYQFPVSQRRRKTVRSDTLYPRADHTSSNTSSRRRSRRRYTLLHNRSTSSNSPIAAPFRRVNRAFGIPRAHRRESGTPSPDSNPPPSNSPCYPPVDRIRCKLLERVARGTPDRRTWT